MKNKIEEKYLEIHNQMANQNGFTEKALWGSKESQEKRFHILSKLFLTKDNFSVIDYGCGLGHFYAFLLKNGFTNIKYIGIDINNKFIDEAQKKHPNLRFELGGREKVEEILMTPVDYLISSGIYNLGSNVDEVEDVFLNDYSSFLNSIKIGLGSNFLSSLSNNKDQQSIYHNPFKLMEKCTKTISKNILYFHNYLPHDFTILIYKDNV